MVTAVTLVTAVTRVIAIATLECIDIVHFTVATDLIQMGQMALRYK